MLNYFGEYSGKDDCGNCSNCSAVFEEKDVTNTASVIIKTIKECHERFGTSVITGTIRGENKAKLRSYGVDRYSTFGMCRQMSESFIKGVIDKMLLDGYLRETDDMYRILKLTETSDMLISGEEHLVTSNGRNEKRIQKRKAYTKKPRCRRPYAV